LEQVSLEYDPSSRLFIRCPGEIEKRLPDGLALETLLAESECLSADESTLDLNHSADKSPTLEFRE
jgi:hypothetical protein